MATKEECDKLKKIMNADECKKPKSEKCKKYFKKEFGKVKTYDMGATITRCERRCDPYQKYGEHKQQVCDLISAIKENQIVIQETGNNTSEGMMLGGENPHRFFYDRDIVHVFDDDTFNNLKKDISIYFKLVKDGENEAIKAGKLIYSPSFTEENKNQTYVLVSPKEAKQNFIDSLIGVKCTGGSTIPIDSTKAKADLICSTNEPNKIGEFKRPSRGSMFKLFRGGKRSNRKGKITNGKGKRSNRKGKITNGKGKKVSKRSKNSRKTSKTKKVSRGYQNRVKKTNKK